MVDGEEGRGAAKLAVVAEAPAPLETPAKGNGTITLEQVRKVAPAVNAMGGFHRVTEILEVISRRERGTRFRLTG